MQERSHSLNTPTSDRWSSRLSFILAATGAAVGLGNIWKFPYMVGDDGGSAFVMVYLVCVALIGVPIMIAEVVIGRCGRRNPVGSLQVLAEQAQRSSHWQYLGWWGAGTLLLVLSFYSVVCGWSLGYVLYACTGAFAQLSAAGVTQLWQHFLASPGQLLLWHTVFMILTLGVVARGVRQGLEQAVKWMMPGLFIILCVLVAYAASTQGFMQGVRFLFDFDVHKITAEVVIDAMGHAFFSLAIGAGCMLVYGAYLPAETRIASTSIVITGLNIAVALLSGLAIFPLVFTHHLLPQGGPGLMFQILPIAFSKMAAGRVFGTLFFLLLLFAGWTSSISLAEPLVILLMERFRLRRGSASMMVGVVAWFIGIGSLLSFNSWSGYTVLGCWTFFDAVTNLSTNFMLPVGGLLFALFVGWGLSGRDLQVSLGLSSRLMYRLWLGLIRYVAPVGIIIILLAPIRL